MAETVRFRSKMVEINGVKKQVVVRVAISFVAYHAFRVFFFF